MKVINILLTALTLIVTVFICILVVVSIGIIMLLAVSFILIAIKINLDWFSTGGAIVAILGSIFIILVLLLGIASIYELIDKLFDNTSNERDVKKVKLKKGK